MPAGFPNVQLKLLGVDFNVIDAAGSPKHALGIELDCDDGTRRKYVRAGAAIVANAALRVDAAEGSYDFDPTSAVAQPIAGVNNVGAIADNEFFWATVRGKATVKVAAVIVAGAHLVSSAVLGELDDAVAAAADAQAAAAGIGVTAVADDVPSAGLATVVLS